MPLGDLFIFFSVLIKFHRIRAKARKARENLFFKILGIKAQAERKKRKKIIQINLLDDGIINIHG